MPSAPAPIHELDLSARLESDGYAVLENLITPAEVAGLLAVFDSLDCEAQHGAWTASIFSSDVAYRTTVHRAIRDVVSRRTATLFPGYRFCFCNFLVKDPERAAGGVVQIHQDPTFVDETLYSSLGLWIPLIDTDATNGGISVLPGSHRWNDGPRSFGGWSPYMDLLPTLLDEAQPVPLTAGSALVFSQKLFHGSRPNRSDAKRVVAASLLISNGAQLRCYHAEPTMPDKLEVFAVDDDFYTRYKYASRPEGVPRIAVVDRSYDPIGPAQLEAARRHEHVVGK